MNVLIATRNTDKFSLVSQMIAMLFPNITLSSLSSARIDGDIEESGTMEDRALHKAKFYYEQLKKMNRSAEFDAVLGIDDGIQIGGAVPSPNSYELTDNILNGMWPVGQEVVIVRAFSLVKQNGEEKTVTTCVPFVYLGNKNKIKREETTYPLNFVLGPVNSAVCYSELKPEEGNNYNVQHSKNGLLALLG